MVLLATDDNDMVYISNPNGGKNDSNWTTSSHYMALLATDNNDMVYISNPNGGKNDSKSSGWYKFKEITPYIAKALYIESYN
ncbi:unknown [Clostridium sp. CAG:492]|nr:unknown [Clostridium sp. CAG:492]